MYSIRTVAGEELPGCSKFTSFVCAGLLARRELWPRFIATEASTTGTAIGAALMEVLEDGSRVRLCSVNVLSGYRRLGVASALLRAAEEEARQRDCSLIYANLVQKDLPPAADISGLLRKSEWTELAARGVICATNLATILQAPWMKHTKIASDCKLSLWKEIPEQERTRLRERLRRQPWFLEAISPFDHEERLVPETSLALRHQGEIAGWCIFHRVNSFATECVSLVVVPELQGRGQAVALLTRGIDLHRNLQDHRKFIFDIGYDKNAMMKFFNRRLVPYLTSMRTVYRSTKHLNSRIQAGGLTA